MTRTKTRPFLAATAIVATAALAVLGGAFGGGGSHRARPAPAPHTSSADDALLSELLSGLSTQDSAQYVAKLEHRVAQRPDPDTLLLLGFAYQQRARETGDPTFFSLSERALRRAQHSSKRVGLVDTGLATLAVSRHQFAAALPLARAALHDDPNNGSAYGALGDGYLNLGRYRQAFAAYDRMAELSPSAGSYGRVAHGRQLLGKPDAAAQALKLSLTLDISVREHRAAALVQLGDVNYDVGRLDRAEHAYRAALKARPAEVKADAGLARVAAARGDYADAERRFNHVIDLLPLPQYAIWRGDVLQTEGKTAEARQAYALVGAIERELAANGVRTDLQTALVDVDQGQTCPGVIARARAAYADAPSIDAADVLAWALARGGRCHEALGYSREALRLGTRDALKQFHRGMIERCLGNAAESQAWFRRALATNPNFSLIWAPVARRYAR
jgi:tetratricopeptide (TPR) repeat protein